MKTKYRVIMKADGTKVTLNNVTTIRLCRDTWEQLIGTVDDYDKKAAAVIKLGFANLTVDYSCFCCAQLNKWDEKNVCGECLLLPLWSNGCPDAPCELSGPYIDWQSGDITAAQKIVDFCNAELRRRHAKLR